MSNIRATREATALLPSLVQLFVEPPTADPGKCGACDGFGEIINPHHNSGHSTCRHCRGNGWPNGVNPFKERA